MITNTNNKKTGSDKQFPGKLHDMMSFVESNSLEYIISWEMNGFGLSINNPDRLVDILPLFFGQTKYRSFRRQMNMWHFHRILDGPYKGLFIHPYFVRHDRALCCQMSRHLPFKPTPQKEQEYIALVSSCKVVTPSTTPAIESSSSSPIVEQPSFTLDTKVIMSNIENDSMFLPTNTFSSSLSTPDVQQQQLFRIDQPSDIKSLDMMLQELEDDVTDSKVNDESSDVTSISSSNLGWFENGDFFSLDDIFP